MCHGHPRTHPCSHMSINWHYCPAATIDLETGVETACSNLTYATAQPSKTECPLLNCMFMALGGSWTCCQCNQGPNDKGWCTMSVPNQQDDGGVAADETRTCDHGCCADCTRYIPTRAATPDMTFGELRKGTASRKFGYGSASRSHRRGSALSKINGFPPVDEEVETTSPSASGASSRSSVSHKSSISSNSASCRSSASAGRGSAHREGSKRHKSSSGKSTKKSQKSLRSH
ncbi:hypothetical protein CTA2_11704 [Colletotrichum tanaceti]|uniref:Uncharacterized protein n=1 Tax=Colletotrichum tanaceti TaxID=1306861 RepID=A0A4V6DH22_9PEZI|nr:hypothetical protein CTA2_11704 [Colletotrichum tanaceti]TKW54996.1 hypothetical protein CTA1_13394 [Colletotrichum tanaceti]